MNTGHVRFFGPRKPNPEPVMCIFIRKVQGVVLCTVIGDDTIERSLKRNPCHRAGGFNYPFISEVGGHGDDSYRGPHHTVGWINWHCNGFEFNPGPIFCIFFR